MKKDYRLNTGVYEMNKEELLTMLESVVIYLNAVGRYPDGEIIIALAGIEKNEPSA